MKPTKKNAKPGRRTLIGIALTIAGVAVIAALIVSQLPQVSAGVSGNRAATVLLPATGTPKFSVQGEYNGGGHQYNVSSAPCYHAAVLTFECNVTLLPTPNNGNCNPCTVVFLNYTDMGSGSLPSNFYFISSDPTMPLDLLGGGGSGVTLAMWFQVVPHAGPVSAFIGFQS